MGYIEISNKFFTAQMSNPKRILINFKELLRLHCEHGSLNAFKMDLFKSFGLNFTTYSNTDNINIDDPYLDVHFIVENEKLFVCSILKHNIAFTILCT